MRASSLSDERVIRLVSSYFVPVHVSRDNYLMPTPDAATNRELQRIDAERRLKRLEGGIVAVYILDPDGTVRASIPVQQAYYPDRFVVFLEKVIAEVSAEPRRPEDVRRTAATPPPPPRPTSADTLALTVWTRSASGKTKGDTTIDFLDLKADEWSRFAPAADAQVGATWTVPEATADRLFLLCYPPGPHWTTKDNKIVERTLTATLDSVEGEECVVRLSGRVNMFHPWSGKATDPHVVVPVVGYVHYDRGRKAITTFNLVSVEAVNLRTWQGANLPKEPFAVGVGMRTVDPER
jgi:hypothetical protein